MELLVPIKDKLSARLAINLGCKALYLAGPAYSARHDAGIAFADLEKIIDYAHRYACRVYLTLNTIIFDEQLRDVYHYLERLVDLNIDALIIQDLGLLSYVRKVYPDLEIHASTQMNLHNSAALALAVDNNIKRVVLPRELSLTKIKEYHQKFPKLAFEVFIHGALCTSYSGQCYYSAFYQTGSGNLGTCEQNCRRPHYFTHNHEYQLNLKDLCVGKNLKLLAGSVASLKIEGRLKSLTYLYSAIIYYQTLLSTKKITATMSDNLTIAFNREFSTGKLFNNDSAALNNMTRANNKGLRVGKVINFNHKELIIKLDKPLYVHDHIRIVSRAKETGQLIKELFFAGKSCQHCMQGIIKVKNECQLNYLGEVFVVKTERLDTQIKHFLTPYLNKKTIDLELLIMIDQPLQAYVAGHLIESDFLVPKAISQPLSFAAIKKQLAKTNDSAYYFNININGVDNVFIAKSQLNRFRKTIIASLDNLNLKRVKLSKYVYHFPQTLRPKFKGYKFMIRTLEQAIVLAKHRITEVYVDNLAILEAVSTMFKVIIPVLPRVVKDEYRDDISAKVAAYPKVMVSELGMLNYFKGKKELEANYYLNITNVLGLSFLKSYGVSNTIISLEDKKFAQTIPEMEFTTLAYGYIPLMIMEYCPVNKNKKDRCLSCHRCQDKQYYLKNSLHKKLPLVYRGYDTLELFSDKPLKRNLVANHQLISFTIEKEAAVNEVLSKLNCKNNE